MTREQGIKKLKRVLGAKAYWRIGESISSPERREAMTKTWLQAQFVTAMAHADLTFRREQLLNGDALYQTLKAAHAEAKQAEQKAVLGSSQYYRFEVGTYTASPIGNILHQRAAGDTWEEVFDKLQKKD